MPITLPFFLASPMAAFKRTPLKARQCAQMCKTDIGTGSGNAEYNTGSPLTAAGHSKIVGKLTYAAGTGGLLSNFNMAIDCYMNGSASSISRVHLGNEFRNPGFWPPLYDVSNPFGSHAAHPGDLVVVGNGLIGNTGGIFLTGMAGFNSDAGSGFFFRRGHYSISWDIYTAPECPSVGSWYVGPYPDGDFTRGPLALPLAAMSMNGNYVTSFNTLAASSANSMIYPESSYGLGSKSDFWIPTTRANWRAGDKDEADATVYGNWSDPGNGNPASWRGAAYGWCYTDVYCGLIDPDNVVDRSSNFSADPDIPGLADGTLVAQTTVEIQYIG